VEPPPASFDLTNGADSLSGTSADDVFRGVLTDGDGTTTLNAEDVLDGGAGHDTLDIDIRNFVAIPAATVAGIEEVLLRNRIGGDYVLDAAALGFATVLAFDLQDGGFDVTHLAAGQQVRVAQGGTATLDLHWAAEADTAQIALDAGTVVNLQVAGQSLGTTRVNLAAAPGTSQLINTLYLEGPENNELSIDTGGADLELRLLDADADATRITLVGEGGVVTLGSLSAEIDILDGSSFGGDIVVDAFGISEANGDFVFQGGQGDDTFHARWALTTGFANAGEGHDTLVLHAPGLIANAEAGARYAGFEHLVTGPGTNLDMDHLAGITSIAVTDGAGATLLRNLTVQQAANISFLGANGPNGAITLEVTNPQAADNAVRLSLVGDGTDFRFGALGLQGVETLRIDATGSQQIAQLLLGRAPQLQEVVVMGRQTMSIDAGNVNLAAAARFDLAQAGAVSFEAANAQRADGTPGFTVLGSLAGSNYFGGSHKADSFTGGAASDAVLYQNGGADRLTLGGAGDGVVIEGVVGGAAIGEGLTLVFARGDSTARAGASGSFDAALHFDSDRTDEVIGIMQNYTFSATAGFRFTIETQTSTQQAQAVHLQRASEFAFGRAIETGGFLVLSNHEIEANTAYVFQDDNGDGVLDASDLMVKIVGLDPDFGDGFEAGEFTVAGNRLIFSSLD
jgi:hypothetical protein